MTYNNMIVLYVYYTYHTPYSMRKTDAHSHTDSLTHIHLFYKIPCRAMPCGIVCACMRVHLFAWSKVYTMLYIRIVVYVNVCLHIHFIEQHNTLVAFQSPKCNRMANIEVDQEYKFQLSELQSECVESRECMFELCVVL